MIVTEEEAKTKRCQESFGPVYTTAHGGQAMAVPLPSGSGYALTSSPTFCIGSACMAWRQMARIEGGSLHEIAQPRQGYCGKAGHP